MKFAKIYTLATFASLLSVSAFAQNIVADGSFENPGTAVGSALGVSGGSAYGSWNVFGSHVHAVNTAYSEPSQGVMPFAAQHGQTSIDLTGVANSGYSGVEQSLSTQVGQVYELVFHVGRADGTSGDFSTPSSVGLLLNNVNVGTYTNSDVTPGTTNWKKFTVQFTAVSTSTNLGFANATTDNYFAGLDNVSAAPVPEPASMAILGAGLAALRRRRAKKS